ncbi:MAG: S9 family peptidase [Acidobacteria bacterium]|nr:MAG: S9 family peptidase [Acidobacteriota bacterium]
MTRTRLPWSLLLALALLAAACTPPAPTQPEIARYSIEDFLGTTNFRGASFSPDNSKVLVSSDQTGIWNAYAIPTGGGEPVALTESTTESIYALGYFPSDERFLYTADQGGDELNHVYVREVDGSVRDLTPGEGFKAAFYGWAQDDETFYVATTERDRQRFDVYEYDAETYDRRMVYRNENDLEFASISPDRRTIALSKTVSNADADLYLLDVASGEARNVTPEEGDVVYTPMSFTPDGSALLALTNKDSEFNYLVRYDLADGSWSTVETADWDVSFSYYSRGGAYRITGINNDGRTELRLYDGISGEGVPLPELPDAEISSVGFSRDESMMAFYASTSRTPRDLFVQAVGDGGQPVQLTRSLNPNIDPEDLVMPEVVRFASYDGVEVPGVLYKPHGASAQHKVPALVWVHGGPGGQSRVGYSALIQYLVNHDYAVYAINNRGSSGYGKTFFHMDDRGHGNADLDDCVASKKMLADLGYVDPQRIGIIGGSYGGYMVLAALAFRPQEFAAGVDIFGVSNWWRTLNDIPPWWGESARAYFRNEFGSLDDEEYLKKISPLFHADRIVRPLLVLQGAKDPRVKKVESDEIVAAVKANGVPVEYVVFEDEGHGFRKKENQAKGYRAILAFLDRYLKDGAPRVGGGDAPVG